MSHKAIFQVGRSLEDLRYENAKLRCDVDDIRVQLDTLAKADALSTTALDVEDIQTELEGQSVRIAAIEARSANPVTTSAKTAPPQQSSAKATTPPAPLPPPSPQTFYHFWSTDCAPCMAELSKVTVLARALEAKGVRIRMYAEESAANVDYSREVFREAGGNARWYGRAPRSGSPVRRGLGVSATAQPISALSAGRRTRWSRAGVLQAGDADLLRRCVDQPVEERCK